MWLWTARSRLTRRGRFVRLPRRPWGGGEIDWWCIWRWEFAECVCGRERGFVFGLEERRKSVKWKRIAWRPGQTKPDAAVRMG